MKRSIVNLLVFSALALTADRAMAQPSTINLDVPGPADWNTADNWVIPNVAMRFVPGDGFPTEIVGISNGGIAELTSPAQFEVLGVVIGESHDPAIPNPTEEDGTLNISSSGMLRLVDPGAMGAAALRVGDAGRGVLNITGGSAQADTLTVGGAAGSTLNLSGSARVAISANANLQRTTRIEGPGVIFDVEGDLTVRGTFNPVITGPTHSAITVSTGNANVGGALDVQFSGYSPILGDSWTLIDADRVQGRFAFTSALARALPRGATFDVSYDAGGSGDVVLSLDNRLLLSVNRTTGAASIANVIGDSITFDGYSIASAGGVLDANTWTSFEDNGALGDWREANPTANHLSELHPTGSSTLDVGQSVGIGNPYAFQPVAFGEMVEDLDFSYFTPAGEEFSGIVEYTGLHNTLVLTVNPSTGEAAIGNQSAFSASVDVYSIGSPSGSLLPGDGNWLSLEDQGLGDWHEANPSPFNLSELDPTGSTEMTSGSFFPLGQLFDPAGMQDLTFFFTLDDGTEFDGVVEYIIPPDGTPGDTNGDGLVNIDDLNNVRNNFGAMGSPDGSLTGDAVPFDGIVNIDDLNGVRNNFGAGGAAVPEPSGVTLAMLIASLAMICRRRA